MNIGYTKCKINEPIPQLYNIKSKRGSQNGTDYRKNCGQNPMIYSLRTRHGNYQLHHYDITSLEVLDIFGTWKNTPYQAHLLSRGIRTNWIQLSRGGGTAAVNVSQATYRHM
jgi:hypothetical protein